MNNSRNIITGLLLLTSTVAYSINASKSNSSSQVPIENSDRNEVSRVNHAVFDKLLKAYVSDEGVVNYQSFMKHKTTLENYILSLTSVNTSNLSKNERTAYWINAYNALTIDQILRHYPVSSIAKIANGKIWDRPLPYQFSGKTLTLNDIEKNILLGEDLFDARIHFVINCAAVSCPTLRNTAYTADQLQTMLTANTKAALADPKFNHIATKTAALSQLFDWYKGDFVKAEGSVINFVNKYSTTKINAQTKITYLAYDWSLNGK